MSNAPTLGSLLTAYWTSQSIYVAAKLGLSDLLYQEPQTAAQLASATGTKPEPLYRLLRALASVGIYREESDGRFTLTPMAEELRSDVPHTQRAIALMIGEEHYVAWGELLHCVLTGQSGFEKVYGEPVFNWLSKHPEQAAVFDQAMVSIHGRETAAMIDAYDFSAIGTLADVGGGNGSLLCEVLTRTPGLSGMLCDQPDVLERAKPQLAASGVADRIRTIPTNFFEEVPAGADAYLMRHIIHDWTDEQSVQILRNVRAAIGDDGRLLLVESVIEPGNDPSFGKMLDLNMLVVPGGKERTEQQYRELFSASDFRLERIVPTESGVSVIEAHPV